MIAHAIDFAGDDGLGGSLRLTTFAERPVAWCWASVVGPELGLVTVRDHDVPGPRAGRLEVRGDGLWAELLCETPGEHWSYGLEAFGVELDEPGDVYRGELGRRVPVGLDVEWEITAPPLVLDKGVTVQLGDVRGEILVGPDRIELDGTGARWELDGSGLSPFRSAFAAGAAAVGIDGERSGRSRPGEPDELLTGVRVETRLGADDVPVAGRIVLGESLEVDVDVLAAAPVSLGRARLPRALCRFDSGESSSLGWAEWLQRGATS